jgi:hypothetical protein
MTHEWQELTRITEGEDIVIEQVRLVKRGISINGEFEMPPLSRLTLEDQIFIIAFIRSHGSIKEMEELFDISYPTVKNRLNRISELLEFVEVNPPSTKNEILRDLEKGKITVEEAERLMSAIDMGFETDTENGSQKIKPKYLRVLVESKSDSENSERVNIRVPINLIKAGLKWASFIPKHSQKKVSDALKERGIDMDLGTIKPKDLEELIMNLNDLRVEVDGDEVVQIYCE